MKFVVNSKTLLQNLQTIGGVVVSKPILPILDNFLFGIKEGNLKITATDLETTITTELEVQADGNIHVAIPSKMLMETLRSLPDQPLTLDIDENNFTVEITSETGRYKLNGEPGEDFPKPPSHTADESLQIPAEVLEDSIAKTLFATSNDELRQNLTGVFFEIDENQLNFVATDANRLVRSQRLQIASSSTTSFIVPKKALTQLKSNLTATTGNVQMDYNQNNVFFSFDKVKIISRLIDEKYPDYNAVIPTDNPNKLTIDRSQFLQSVKRIAIYANKTTQQIRLKLAGSEMTLSAEDLDMSNEGTERLSVNYAGADIEIGFNARYLVDMLTNMTTSEVSLELSDPNKAGILLPSEQDENEHLLMLIMPMMLNNG